MFMIKPLKVMVCFIVLGIYGASLLAKNAEETHILKVGLSADFAPFSFVEKGEYVGFDVDVIRIVSKRIGYEIQFIDMPFKTLIPAIQTGAIDVIAAGLSETKERSEHVLFVPAHFAGDPFVIVAKKTMVITEGLKDLSHKTVVVNDGYTAAQYMEQQKGPSMHLLYLKSPSDAIVALETGRADAFITAKSVMNRFFEEHAKADQYQLFVLKGTGESLSLAVSRKKHELYEKIKAAVQQMINDGTLETLKKKWKLS